MVGELSRYLATLLAVVFCALGVGLLAEVAAVGGLWRHRLGWHYWRSLTIGAALLALLNIAVALR